jgi:hypothetical protein
LSIRATDASIVPSLVSVASCVPSNTPILSFMTHQHQFPPCASSPHVPKLEQYPSCEGTVVACAQNKEENK